MDLQSFISSTFGTSHIAFKGLVAWDVVLDRSFAKL